MVKRIEILQLFAYSVAGVLFLMFGIMSLYTNNPDPFPTYFSLVVGALLLLSAIAVIRTMKFSPSQN